MAGKRILVVDDDDSLRMTLVAGLELEGFIAAEADTGERALDLLATRPFDLVLSDIRMPGMGGDELFRQIKRRYPEMPVVLMTAFAGEDIVRGLTDKGAYAVLTKPFDLDRASETFTRAVDRPWILVIDDARPFATSLAEALSTSGISAEAVFDGEAALDIVRRKAVDVCVIDLVMDGLSGPQVIERLQALDPTVRMIAISEQAIPEVIADALRKGARRFLRRPVHPADLLRLIATIRAEPERARN